MWGFLSGTLLLIVIQQVVQPGASDRLAAGGGVIASALSRLLSESVAGVPKTKGAKAAESAATSQQGNGVVPGNVLPGWGALGQTGSPGPNATPEQLQQWAGKMFNG
ncbi:hypothetical protein [Fodinicola feengrottensis]|uniref:Uncharacterized protein n=1 Tax=Fodinicola feengrottensis TaxID=435914 RepID=A0ABN2IKY7_9ACTN|nr:hypothetical protein [Fodinicola feengrottensis]